MPETPRAREGSSSGAPAATAGCGDRPLLGDVQWAYLQRRYELTTRERQIAELVCRGLRNDRVARHLGVRPETVKTHLRNVYRKTGAKSKVLLLLRFLREAEHIFNRA